MNCPYEIVAVVPWGTETWGLKSWSVLFKLRQSPAESGSTSTPVPLAGALHKCAILHFTFLEQTGTGEGHGHFFGICENVLAANNRELSSTGINHNGIYHLTWTELQRDVTARSVAQECKDSGSVLLSCVLASSNGCFSPSLPDGWSSYRSTPKYIIQQWKRKEFWLKKIIREKYSQKPPLVDILLHLIDKTGYLHTCKPALYINGPIVHGLDLSGFTWVMESWKPEENQGWVRMKESKVTVKPRGSTPSLKE